MSLNINEPQITDQLSQSIREMRDFLLSKPSDENCYKILYNKINELVIKMKTESWSGYEHKNPHKTLNDFLNNKNMLELVVKYYSIPAVYKRSWVKQTKIKKTVRHSKKFFEWLFDQISKIKPNIKL